MNNTNQNWANEQRPMGALRACRLKLGIFGKLSGANLGLILDFANP